MEKLKITLEVYPSKISYKEDYQNILKDLNYVFEKLIKAIDTVLNNTYHVLTKEERIVKYHNIKNATSETIRYLEKRPYLMKNVQGRLLPSEALVVK